MAELRKLENNYSKDYREAFEDLATLMFCTYLGLPHGVNRRINQKGIESDPVTIDGKVYAYQAKYYDASTRLYEKKADFINSIEAARKKGVTNLLFFVNKNLPDTDNKSDEEPQYIKDINKAAKGNGKKTEVVLDWWTLSKIETTLDRDEYCYIQRIYLGGISGETGCLPFYDYIYNQFYGDSENQLYGNVPLRDFYIETTVNVKDENDKNQSVRKFIETWLENDGSIAVISGEPGHGKTSLCKKAMCDFYKDGWLAGKVSNVFCFSLNPANTDALANDGFYLYSLLSWGEDRKSSEQVIKKKDCENALVFFDGFDELLEWHPRFDLKTFIREYIVRFQKYSKAHIIITSRNMAVESNKEAYEIEKGVCVPIIRLQLLTRVQQIEWIEKCIDYNKEAMSNELESHRIKGELKRSEHELEEYLKHYKQFSANDKLQTLLGIPIIFRMIVAARYLPKNRVIKVL